jgi:hypothetical protein
VDDDEVAIGHHLVDLEGEVGEGGPQPQGGGVEPAWTWFACLWRLVDRLTVDRGRVQARSKSARPPDAMRNMLFDRRYAVMMGELTSRAGQIYGVLVAAADAEPELADLLRTFEAQRLRAATQVAEAVTARGGLPPGRTVAEARDIIWLCNAPEVYVMLTGKRRWSTRRYVAWARNALLKLVAAPSET